MTATRRLRSRNLRDLAILMAGTLCLAGCGSDRGVDAAPASPPPAGETSVRAKIPPTAVARGFEKFSLSADGDGIMAKPELLPRAPDTLEARWYVADGRYVLLLAGLAPGHGLDFCVNVQYRSTFILFPTTSGACDGGPAADILAGDSRLRRCGPLTLYVTSIPSHITGELWARIVRFHRGAVMGYFSGQPTRPNAAPQIDLGAQGYSIEPDVLPGGPDSITCKSSVPDA